MGRLLTLFSLFLPLSLTVSAAEKVVLYGDDDYAPYSFVENGQFRGIYVDLLKRIAPKLAPEYELELRAVPWKRGLAELERGTSLGLFPPYQRSERTYIQPYSAPLYKESVVLFCNDEVMKTPRKQFPQDFNGLVVGVNAGFTLTDKLQEAAKAGKIKLEEAKGNDANLLKLAAKRIGCYANDAVSVRYSLRRLREAPGALADIKTLTLRDAVELAGENAYVGYSRTFKAPYKDDFIRRLDAALAGLAPEEVNKLVARYIN
ncbi:substrate-binding periplasmic protein [Chitinimonas lacunae]|uniref:Substrate-binding periplasmic protein n=1 Tax=Chitinimonas lacunae TaxID=1963018 RepID=A0ABV8MID4_9NEIS